MITEQVEDELYCRHPLYNMNSQDDRNRPTENYAPNVKKRMALLPKILMEGFEQTFVNGIDHITGRTPENPVAADFKFRQGSARFLGSKVQDRPGGSV